MNEALAELVRLAPPGEAPGRSDWSHVASALGVDGLPADYTELADRYGGGLFDHYLALLHPGCESPDYNLHTIARQQAQALPELWKFEPKPPQLETPGNRVVPWAIAEDGQTLHWLLEPGHPPNAWTVLINEGRGPYWEHHDTGAADLLASLLTGRRTSEILGDAFGPDHTFIPLPTGPAH